MKKSICFCGIDVSSQFRDLRRSFQELGYEVYSFVQYKPQSPIDSQDEYTYVNTEIVPFVHLINVLPFPDKVKKFLKSVSRHVSRFVNYDFTKRAYEQLCSKSDLFVFMYNTIYTDRRDFEYLKSKGKKVVMIFCGDDARWFEAQKQEFESLGLDFIVYPEGYDYSVNGLNYRLQLIRNAEKYADLVYSKREQAQLQKRPFMHFPMAIYGKDFLSELNEQREIPRVVHAPSSPIIKGTKYVQEAVNRLRSEGISFEYIEVQNVPHSEAIEIYKSCDIVIDQLLAPGGGRLSTEGLAYGKVVLSRMNYDKYNQGFPTQGCPIVDVGPHNVYDELKRLIFDLDERTKLASQALPYVKKNLLTEKFCKDMIFFLTQLELEKELEYDHKPQFFEKYKANSYIEYKSLKKWDEVY